MSEIKNKLFSLIGTQFSIDVNDINDSDGPGDILGWDSIGQLQLILKIEQTFNVSFSIDDVMEINSISDINTLIEDKVGVVSHEENIQDIKKSLTQVVKVQSPHQLYIGSDGMGKVFKEANRNKVAIITGSSGYADEVYRSLEQSFNEDFECVRIAKGSGEPDSGEIKAIAEQLHEFKADIILAAGGGSVIDTAKLAWVLYENPTLDVQQVEIEIGQVSLRKKALFAAIPTTFGSGSEASSAAAFNKDGNLSKTIVVSHQLLPDFVFLESVFGLELPESVLYSSAIDALTHAIEGYVSLIENLYASQLAVSAVRNICSALKDIILRGVNNDNITKLMFGSFWAGVVQNQCSVGATHSLSHQLGAYGIGHGKGNALFLLPVIAVNSKQSHKYQELAIEAGYANTDALIEEIKDIIQESNVLRDINYDLLRQNKEVIISGAMRDITFKTNPVSLTSENLDAIIEDVINS
jgi:alcohol dehydrogenase